MTAYAEVRWGCNRESGNNLNNRACGAAHDILSSFLLLHSTIASLLDTRAELLILQYTEPSKPPSE